MMRIDDLTRVGLAGLRTRRSRVVLSALGIAIGIATMITVIGVSASGQERLLQQLDKLGTNLLRVEATAGLGENKAQIPLAAPGMISRIAPINDVSATGDTKATVRRTDRIDRAETGGITVSATTLDLLRTLGGRVRTGVWLNEASERHPVVVLGAVAADRLGIDHTGSQIWIGGRWFTVVGVLDPIPLAEELDRSALVGFTAASTYLGHDGHPGRLYVRSADNAVASVRTVLARTADPEHPERIVVSRPSDALAARAAATGAFTSLLIGLGVVALLVGGIGVANTMVISVLERRPEIGLRRSLGATRNDIRTQFLTESLLLSLLGGCGGLAGGALFTFAYATYQHWPPTIPAWALSGALAAALIVGALAGLYPATKAARLTPTAALRST